MKTAISLPDDLLISADALAARLRMTRSGLIAAALAEYIAKHRAAKVSKRLNEVFSTETSRVSKAVRRAQRRAIGADEW